MSSQLNLQKGERETGGHELSSDQKILPVTGTTVAGVWRGRALAGVLTWSDKSEKTWL
jgi:hypothetical protein